MTLKGVWKLVSQPKQFLKDYVKKSRKSKQKIKFLIERAINLNVPFSIYYYGLYLQLNNQKAFYLAEKALEKAIYKRPSSFYYYKFANILQRKNQWWRVVESYEKAIEMDSRVTLEHYLQYVAALEKMVRFEKICQILKPLAKDNKLNAEGYFKYGVALEKIEEFTLSEEAFTKAIEEDTDYNSQVLGVGIFYEKKGLWIDASKAYEKSLKRDNSNALLQYKFGLALERCYEWEKAEEAYSRAIGLNCHESYWHYKLGFVQERQEKYKKAVESYRDALSCSNNHMPNWYYRLGNVLVKLNKHEEASKAFLEQKIMQDAHGVVEAPFNKDKVLHNLVTYTELYENLPIKENVILYESYHGSAMSCSPYAVFKYLLDDENFSNYVHVWVIADEHSVDTKYREYSNVIFIKKNSKLYMRYLASSKYLINNTTFPDWYIRKENQVYLNTWHGTPIKTLGRDVENDFMAHKNQTKNFLQTSHLIAPNAHTAKVLEESYDIKDIYRGILGTTGYPRQDLMLNISDEEKDTIYDTLNIDSSKKVVLYAPTWRGTVSGATFDTQKLEEDMQYLSTLKDVEILFRGHYMVEKFLKALNIEVTVVPTQIDTNSLLSIVDILITDYSSICFDFMAMDRPIVYYIYDKEEYLRERGLYFDVETIGDYICYDIDEVKTSIETILVEKPLLPLQKRAKKDFCAYDDGLATKRVVDLIFFNKIDNIKVAKQEKKESILIYGGPLMANGITTSFINLCNLIDKQKYSVTITFDPNAILLEDIRVEQFQKLNKDIKVVPRFGRMLMTLEERELIGRFNSGRGLHGDEMWNRFEYAHKREFKRVFGYGKFDHIVNFEGYTVFWSLLMGMKLEGVKSNAVYQHNDLYAEYIMKYPYLKETFETYRFYDKIVSVSEKTKEHNRDNLSKNFQVESGKFIHCDNVQNINNILEKAKEEIGEESHKDIFNKKKVFINIGRLSPEKGHMKLINAFAKVHQKYPEVCLVNLGSGVLEKEIQQLIKKLKLTKNIFYLGQVSNPYSYLNASDCFILPSDHEGQPMTLLEALILEKPIIATDIVGNRSVLENRPGMLVENSEEGVYKGMIDFIEGNHKEEKLFDANEYNESALSMFYGKVLAVQKG